MFFSILAFFKKFGLAFIITILEAVIGSFFVFLTITLCFGPSSPGSLVDTCFGVSDNEEANSEDKSSSDERTEDNSHRIESTDSNDKMARALALLRLEQEVEPAGSLDEIEVRIERL